MYTLEDKRNVKVDLHVEGMRPGWQTRMVGNAELLDDEHDRGVFTFALRALLAEFQPPAYLTSEPIARLEYHLWNVAREIEQG